MEGASRWRTLVTVFLPLAVPAIVVTAIFTFINAWNEFVIALTMLRREDELYAAASGVLARRRALHGGLALRHGGARWSPPCRSRCCLPGCSATSCADSRSER